MKVKSILAALLLIIAGLQTVQAQKIILRFTDKSMLEYDISSLECVEFSQEVEHEWVDLGLPSGTKWATCNVGANSPEEYGDYFAWGETTTKGEYSWGTYKYCQFDDYYLDKKMTKYCASYNDGIKDDLTELQPSDDAATANWGSPWHMPTYTQQEELRENCRRTWTTQNGVNGMLVTGPNGNTIFFPAAGSIWDTERSEVGVVGYYWSSSLHIYDSYNANYQCFGSIFWDSDTSYGRRIGRSVRAVRP